MYEMFLGPLTDAKPWNTNGITGVHNFLRKYWRLFHTEKGDFQVSDAEPTKDELKALHKLIKKVADDVENLSLNTSVSAFMVCVNELSSLKCNKRAVLGELTVVLSSLRPHIAEETWHLLGNAGSVTRAPYPAYNESYLVEDSFEYPVSINGKVRAKMTFPPTPPRPKSKAPCWLRRPCRRWLEGKQPKKIIVVPKRIVNVVL
jgi:leucyl-tRNA synthetase